MTAILLRQVAARLVVAIPTLLVVTLFTYAMLFQVGDPAASIAGDNATAEQIAQIRHSLGLDRPFLTQYGDWLSHALHGDLGQSLHHEGSTTYLLSRYLPPTLWLVGGAMLLSIVCSLIMGMISGLRPNGIVDRGFRLISMLGIAVPNFLLGLVLVLIFAVQAQALPAAGYRPFSEGAGQAIQYLILPVIALALALICQQARTLRAAVLKEYQADYVRTARMKNLSESAIFFRHVLRNALAPLVTVIGLEVGALVTGAVLVEAVFAIPGIGTLAIQSVRGQDFAVVQALIALAALVVIGANLLADLVATWLNPVSRVRHG